MENKKLIMSAIVVTSLYSGAAFADDDTSKEAAKAKVVSEEMAKKTPDAAEECTECKSPEGRCGCMNPKPKPKTKSDSCSECEPKN